jgi:hypothetical protein
MVYLKTTSGNLWNWATIFFANQKYYLYHSQKDGFLYTISHIYTTIVICSGKKKKKVHKISLNINYFLIHQVLPLNINLKKCQIVTRKKRTCEILKITLNNIWPVKFVNIRRRYNFWVYVTHFFLKLWVQKNKTKGREKIME